MRVTRTESGVELYFAPLRAPGAAATAGFFGAACLAPSLLAAAALLPRDASDAPGLLALVLISAFVVPFVAFGVMFVAIAVYMLANSLTVNVTASAIRTTRRVFGFGLAPRELKSGEIAAIEAEVPAKYQSLFGTEPRYRLVAHASARAVAASAPRRLIVAENLNGASAMEQVRQLIASSARIGEAPRST